MDSRYTLEGSGVAPGAKTFFMALFGMLGEKVDVGGLSLMADALKMFLAVAIELPFRLLDGTSSRVVNIFRLDEAWGVPRRLAEELPNGDAAA